MRPGLLYLLWPRPRLGERGQYLEEAVRLHQQSIAVFTLDDMPAHYAQVQAAMSSACLELSKLKPSNERKRYLKMAEDALQEAQAASGVQR